MRYPLLLLLTVLFSSSVAAADAEVSKAEEPRKIFWDALMPEGWSPPEPEIEDFFEGPAGPPLPLDQAPTVPAMNGQYVSLPGYIVPIKTVGDDLAEFLLVPYFGACVHVPPPPPNQVVLVVMKKPVRLDDPYEAYWVNGILSTSAGKTDLAETGYTMSGETLAVFDWDATYQPEPESESGPAPAQD